MKKAILFFFIILFTTVNLSQGIFNNSFENWEGGVPAGWFTSNLLNIYVPITQSSDAHSGSSAVQGNVINVPGGSGYSPIMAAGLDAKGFPINIRPSVLKGWYKFTSDSGDAFSVSVVAVKGRRAIASGGLYSSESRSSYTEFSVNLTYLSTEIPDTIQIVILIANNGIIHTGSWYILDDLSLEVSTDVNDPVEIADYLLEQNYPNPFNPVTNFEFSLAESGLVTLKIYDIQGTEVAAILNENKPAGKHKLQYDAGKLTSGVYFYELRTNNFRDVKKLVLLK